MNTNDKIDKLIAEKISLNDFRKGTLGINSTGVGILPVTNLLGISDFYTIDPLPRVQYVQKFSISLAEYFIGYFYQNYLSEISIEGSNQDIFVIKTNIIYDLKTIDKWVLDILEQPKISQLLSTIYTLGFKDFVITTWENEYVYTYKLIENLF
jgi:hypothetical protein